MVYADSKRNYKIKYVEPDNAWVSEWMAISQKFVHNDSPAKNWNWHTIKNVYANSIKMLNQSPEIVGLEINGIKAGIMQMAHNVQIQKRVLNHNILPSKKEKEYDFRIDESSLFSRGKENQKLFTNEKQSGSFVWYFQAAPNDYLVNQGIKMLNGVDGKQRLPFDVGVGKMMMHYAITASQNRGDKGRVTLHADPSGGEKLMGLYDKGFGLKKVLDSARITTLRKNDGRYFEVLGDGESYGDNKKYEAQQVKNFLLKNMFNPKEDLSLGVKLSNKMKIKI